MARDRLLIIAAVLIVVGAAGILATSHFGTDRQYPHGFLPGGGMMKDGGMRRGGGMMGRRQMAEMMKGMMGNMLPHGVKPEDLPDPGSQGVNLVARFCSQCHDIPSPALHAAQEWPAVESRMFARMSMMSGMPMMKGMGMEIPSPEERKAITDYMKTNAMKPADLGALPQRESAAAVSFKTVCSQCHPLPDPKLHTAQDWPGIVERMRGHMKEMGKPVINDRERDRISGYLSRLGKKMIR